MPKGQPYRKRRQVRFAILSPKEIKFLKHYIKTGNQSESALAAGSVSAHPEVVGSMLMKKLREKCPEILLRIGLHQEKIFKKILIPGLEAMKTELASFNKIFTDSKELVDHEQRGKYFDRYCKLLGLYPNGREESGDSRAAPTVVINLGFLEPERAKQVLEDARKRAGLSSGGQPVLDAAVDEDEGRAGPDPPV